MNKPKILVIVGPTASGKTSLSIELAKVCNGEVVSADSRQVYRGLDIGTGKVTKTEMQGVPHHLIDVVNPEDPYTVADYVRDGRIAIAGILSQGKLPIIVGGTFFYIDALLGKVNAPEVPPNEILRNELEKLTPSLLIERLSESDPKHAESIDKNNKRRIIRAIEIAEYLGKVPPIIANELYNVLTLGITIEKEGLRNNIHKRLVDRLQNGMFEETIQLEKSGLSCERLSELGIEYEYMCKFLHGDISKDDMCKEIETKSWHYAKRQMTWLKRDKSIQWVDKNDTEGIKKLIFDFLI